MLGVPSPLFARGETVAPPPVTYGPELVTNGGFASDIAGWSSLGGTLLWSAGKLRVTSAGTDNGARQTILGLEVEATYRLTVSMIPSESDRARIVIYCGGYQSFFHAVVGSVLNIEFVAAASGIDINLQAASASAWASSGAYAEFDNVSLQKRL